MSVTPFLVTVHELAVALRTTIDDEDEYALLMTAQASQAVRDAAKQPTWVRVLTPELGDPPAGTTLAPQTALDIACWVAQRAYTDPRNRSRITSGPISDSFFENGVYGLDLTAGEKERLRPLSTDSDVMGLWSIKTGSAHRVPPIVLADARPGSDAILYADPAYAWAFTARGA